MKTYNEIVDDIENLTKEDTKLNDRISATEQSIETLTEFAQQASSDFEELAGVVGSIVEKVTVISYDAIEQKTTVGSDLDIQGDLTVNGSPVGVQKFYIHNINFYRQYNQDYWYLNLQIITTSQTPFTTTTLGAYLTTNGHTTLTKPHIANGSHYTSSGKYEITGIICNMGSLYPVMFDLSSGEDLANTALPSTANLTDNVKELK